MPVSPFKNVRLTENIFAMYAGPLSVGERGSAAVVGRNDGDDEDVRFRADGVCPHRLPDRLS